MKTLTSSLGVSVITPVFNAEEFLEDAINSVLKQSFQDWELLLVNDGSHDRSPEIAKGYAKRYPNKIHYIEHPGHANCGPLATRILGAQHAQADMIALLDADDLWDPEYLESHLNLWQTFQDSKIAASYGPAHFWFFKDDSGAQDYVQTMPSATPRIYQPGELLESFLTTRYATTPCTDCLLIRREIFLEIERFKNVAKKSRCFEDQFLSWYLAIHYPIIVHNNVWVHYRQYETSFTTSQSAEDSIHIESFFLQRIQEYLEHVIPDHPLLQTQAIARRIQKLSSPPPRETTLVRQHLKACLPAEVYGGLSMLYRKIARVIRYPQKILSLTKLIHARFRLAIGIKPLSDLWGSDRGQPILRYYAEQFLREFQQDIQGHCVEFMDNRYTSRFGGKRVQKIDILHLDGSNPYATLIGDLTQPNNFPSDAFDCILCTYVLHTIFRPDIAMQELYRMLKPGGVLLVIVPHVSMCDPQWHELWRFTDEGLQQLLATSFGDEHVTIRAYGNALTAAGNIRGLAAHEFTRAELDVNDPRFASLVCARAVKQPDPEAGTHGEML